MINLHDYMGSDTALFITEIETDIKKNLRESSVIKSHTQAFQKAVDDCYNRGGGTVFIPCATYYMSTVELRSGVNLLFEDGTKIFASTNLGDFYADETFDFPLYQDISHSSYTFSLFWGNCISDISIKGKATINMQSIWDHGDTRDNAKRGAKVISIENSKNITILDLQIHNATDIAVLICNSTDIFISKLYLSVYIDGISLDGCKRAVISDCIVHSGDDGIVFKASYCQNKLIHNKYITVTNCVINSRCSAIKIGTETNGDFKFITISNCVVYNTRLSGIAIESVDGGNIDGLSISNITMENVGTPLFVKLGNRLRGPQGIEAGSISNVRITDLYATINPELYEVIEWNYDSFMKKSRTEKPRSFTCSIVGLNDRKIKNFSLTNVTVESLGGYSGPIPTFRENDSGYPECNMYGELPAYGLFVKNTDNLVMNNVSFVCKNKDDRKDIVISD